MPADNAETTETTETAERGSTATAEQGTGGIARVDVSAARGAT